MAAHDRGDLGDRLDRPDFVVGVHHRHEDGLVRDRRLDGVRIDAAVAIDRQLDDLEAELLEIAQRVLDSVMLDGRRHDLVATRPTRPRGPFQREVVRLRAAAREDDLARLGAERMGEPVVRVVQRSAGPAAVPVGRRGVAEVLREVRQHRVQHLAAHRASSRRGRGRSAPPDCTRGPFADRRAD